MMMRSYVRDLVCDDCGAAAPPNPAATVCTGCRGLLEARYDMASARRELDPSSMVARPSTMWRWRELLPVAEDTAVVTLGEGGTPLVRSRYVAERTGLRNLFFKNDSMMPTGSFKDRGFALAVTRMCESGRHRGVTYSSGNAAASLCAYASRAGREVAVFVEAAASGLKVESIQAYGAPIIRFEFGDLREIERLMLWINEHTTLYGFVNFLNPYRHEAMKTVAFEVASDLAEVRGELRAPDVMVQPVGTGGGLHGAFKGFKEMLALGWTLAVPRMVAVQPSANAYLRPAFESGLREASPHGRTGVTVAQSISSHVPLRGARRVLKDIYESDGRAEAVGDEEITEAVRWLARDGIFAEPAAAAPVAALRHLVADGGVHPDETVVCVVTATGLKQPGAVPFGPSNLLSAGSGDLIAALECIWPRSEWAADEDIASGERSHAT